MDADRIGAAVEQFLLRHGYELTDFQLGSAGHRGRLYRVFLDRLDLVPVTIDNCAALSLPLKLFLSSLGAFDDDSRLEVSSPGLDRVLKRNKDFERYRGSRVRVSFREEGKKRTVVGVLTGWSDTGLEILDQEPRAAEAFSVPRSEVIEARLVAEV